MLEDKIISLKALTEFGPVDSLNQQAVALVQQQKQNWDLARKNYAAVSEVQKKVFSFGHFEIEVHHNPERMRSSAAKTDAHTIARRPCFLCAHNLPPEQKGLLFENDYLILCNPFPIFPVHLTIPKIQHVPQRITGFIADMLDLSRLLPGFTVFYNGPRCGASAPDHFHFQAVQGGHLPVEKELNTLVNEYSKASFKKKGIEIYAVENYLRRLLVFISPDRDALMGAFDHLYASLPENEREEPMLNVLVGYEAGTWKLLVFPRDRQRPSHFFLTGKNQIIVGPAAVEMGGILVLPRQGDFEKINNDIIAEVFKEVTLSAENFDRLAGTMELYR